MNLHQEPGLSLCDHDEAVFVPGGGISRRARTPREPEVVILVTDGYTTEGYTNCQMRSISASRWPQ